MFNQILNYLNDFLYSNILIVLLLFAGLFFSFRTGFVQIRHFADGIKTLFEKNQKPGTISAFQALMISTASRVGTGNIAGVATAIAAGGPGAVFWMWVTAIIGGASAFSESALAQVYKIHDKDGEGFRGGPAYYIEKALKMRWLGIVFAILLILTFAFGFNALQSFNVSSAFEYYSFGSKTVISAVCGLVLALLTAATIFGGTQRIGIITSYVVPFMALIYIGIGIFITLKNIGLIPFVFLQIVRQAFDFRAIFGGFTGSCVMYGIKRGLFSNEAGMGSAPNAEASADVSHPAKQGFVQMISVFIDTILICTTTAMILLVYDNSGNLTGIPFVQAAVSSQIGSFGIHFITVSIFLFAFSSLVGNYCYAEANFRFITENKAYLTMFRFICVFCVFVGAMMEFDTVWNIADILMGFMAIINIVVILILNKVVIKVLKDYRAKKKAGGEIDFHPKELDIKGTECWD